ncbi:unnamed protein product [Oppiella nova]|uniref:XPG-I domain-containing protein n=1 Tax=Oppiella nova TaxID=334625 RepID=A0A7R9LBE7_9ACAR|nr:unnamed protein product [Oppiella nova]CAG2161857.1 unnamed protein product [Oppiella nova]
MRFTKIKAIEVNTDSDSDGFEEVGPLTTDAMSAPNIEPLNVKESVGLSETDRVGTEEECVDGIDENKTHLNTEINSLADEDSLSDIPEETIKGLEPSPSKSSTNFESISREELINSYREVNNQNRLTNHTTDQMMSDCQELLRLFGIPFILSPTEAEAQCAALELLGLTDGTITDDSDVLLFGAQNVYKNFFTESKFVELFTAKDIETRFGLTRSSMICIALLCGSDYTDGVDGVGAVTATEILSEFPGDGLKPLLDLKDWLTTKHNSTDKRPDNKIREKFLKIKVNDSFPNRVIFDAYMNPTVDKSEEKFLWAMPQLEELRRYASTRFGWTQTKTDSILLPVLKKVNEKQTQQTIDGYFKVQVQPKETALLSKRLSKAINKLRGKESEPAMSASTSSKTSQLTNKVKNQRKKRPTNVNTNKVNPKSKKRKTNTRTQTPKELTLSETSSDSD